MHEINQLRPLLDPTAESASPTDPMAASKYLDSVSKAYGCDESDEPHHTVSADHDIKAEPVAVDDPACFSPSAPSTSRKTDIQKHSPLSQVHNARNAFLFAEDKLASPLNTFLTINLNRHRRHWDTGRSSKSQVAHVRDKVFKALTDWCDHHKIAPLWVYAAENPPQGGHGPHLHILLHLPPERWTQLSASLEEALQASMKWSDEQLQEVRRKMEEMAASGCSRSSSPEAWLPFHISPSEQGAGNALSGRERLIRLRYLCKSVDPQEMVTIGGIKQTIERHAGLSQSPDISLDDCGDPRTKKRIGASRMLSRDARRAAGWHEIGDLGWLSRKIERDALNARVQAILREAFSISAKTGAPVNPASAEGAEPTLEPILFEGCVLPSPGSDLCPEPSRATTSDVSGSERAVDSGGGGRALPESEPVSILNLTGFEYTCFKHGLLDLDEIAKHRDRFAELEREGKELVWIFPALRKAKENGTRADVGKLLDDLHDGLIPEPPPMFPRPRKPYRKRCSGALLQWPFCECLICSRHRASSYPYV